MHSKQRIGNILDVRTLDFCALLASITASDVSSMRFSFTVSTRCLCCRRILGSCLPDITCPLNTGTTRLCKRLPMERYRSNTFICSQNEGWIKGEAGRVSERAGQEVSSFPQEPQPEVQEVSSRMLMQHCE